MHLIVPFAAPLSEAGKHAARTLKLPQLQARLAQLTQIHRDEGDEYSMTPPHERAMARVLRLQGGDGQLPWAALHAQNDGIATLDLAWGELTPVHWQVGTDQVQLFDPQALALDDDTSRAIFDAVRPLFEGEGFALAYGAPLRWYAAHESLADFPTASLDRVIGRNVDPWLPEGPRARLLRRLQAEVQMLLYTHPITAAREAAAALPVNSFWLSGCGATQRPHDAREMRVDDRLRAPALAEDWGAWLAAWDALDAGLGDVATLTLCGERSSVTFEARPLGLWQRLTRRAPSLAALLESL